MVLTQCLWVFSFDVKTMITAPCFWALIIFVIAYLLAYTNVCVIFVSFIYLVAPLALVHCT